MNWDWLNLWLKTIEVLSITNWSCLAFEMVYPQKHSRLRDIMVTHNWPFLYIIVRRMYLNEMAGSPNFKFIQ